MLSTGEGLQTRYCHHGVHNICIEHGLHWESEFDVNGEEDEETILHDSTTSGTAVRKSVVDQYINEQLL